jgi:hypothetical protein
MRRREVLSKEPNAAHRALVELERHPGFDVEVITLMCFLNKIE